MSNERKDVITIYEDEYLLVLDKPANILVHPTEARERNTLVDYLIDMKKVEPKLAWPDPHRPGIVHRLDKDTSGVILISKNPETLLKLQDNFKNRKIDKEYLGLCWGKISPEKGKIETGLLRDKSGIQKAIIFQSPYAEGTIKTAVTFYETLKIYKYQKSFLSLLKIIPKTGRMHQIRAHLKFIGSPIIGDPLYNNKLSRKISKALGIKRQFLHASKIKFQHPELKNKVEFNSPLPSDLSNLLKKFKMKSI